MTNLKLGLKPWVLELYQYFHVMPLSFLWHGQVCFLVHLSFMEIEQHKFW